MIKVVYTSTLNIKTNKARNFLYKYFEMYFKY